MSAPAAQITGTVTCALCGQVSVDTRGEPMAWTEAQSLLRAHQRSPVCS